MSAAESDFEHPRSAADDDLAQSIEIQSTAEGWEQAADLPVAQSAQRRPRPASSGSSAFRSRPLPNFDDPADDARPTPSPAAGVPGAGLPAGSVPARADRTTEPSPASDSTPIEPVAAGTAVPDDAAGGASGVGGSGDGTGGNGTGRTARRRTKGKAPWWELPLLIAIAVVIAVVVKTFVVQPFYIPSASMEQTLHGCPGCSGDRVLVNKPVYDFRDPHPGDIVVFRAPFGWDDEPASIPPANPVLRTLRGFGQLVGVVPPDEQDLIKRVIAVGGQTVQCCDSQGRVQVANNPKGPFVSLNEPYVYRDGPDFWTPADKPGQPLSNPADSRTFGPVTVPKGRLWVMGDHRNNSADSAYHWRTTSGDVQESTVPISSVIGKAFVIAWPPSRWRTLGTPATFAADPLPAAAGMLTVLPLGLARRRRRRRRRG